MKVNRFFGLDGKEKASPAKYGKHAPVWICRELSGSQESEATPLFLKDVKQKLHHITRNYF